MKSTWKIYFLQERFGKSIVSAKDVSRTRIFKENLMKIASHNLEAEAGKHSWIKAVNQFADMVKYFQSKLTVAF